jgi:hypothetical protein
MSAQRTRTRPNESAEPAERVELKRQLRAKVACIEEVELLATGDGLCAQLRLDRLMIQSRAEQQGLEDKSVRGAATNPRFQRYVTEAIDAVNADMSDHGLVVTDYVIETT